MRLFPKKSKRGVTLVESVIAVVVLGIFATGILSLLTAGGAKIMKISGESAAYAAATQKMDLVVASISNDATSYPLIDNTDPENPVYLAKVTFAAEGASVTATLEKLVSDEPATTMNIRGWYLELTYQGVTVKSFASFTQGAFDTPAAPAPTEGGT